VAKKKASAPRKAARRGGRAAAGKPVARAVPMKKAPAAQPAAPMLEPEPAPAGQAELPLNPNGGEGPVESEG
jgi:hypothetical protein